MPIVVGAVDQDASAATKKYVDDAVAIPTAVSINVISDGGGSVIPSGVVGDLKVDFDCTVQEWTLLADQAGSAVVDIWVDTVGASPPTVADSITASAKPTLSSAQHATSSTLTGWTTSIPAGSVIRFNVDSAATVQRLTISLKLTRYGPATPGQHSADEITFDDSTAGLGATDVQAAIEAIAAGSGSFSSPMTTAGDMIYEAGGTERALGCTTTPSSVLSGLGGANAVDGSDGTFWASSGGAGEYLVLDLGSSFTIASFQLKQLAACRVASGYKVQTGTSSTGPWTDVYSTTSGAVGDSGVVSLPGGPYASRYWRVLCTAFSDGCQWAITTINLYEAVSAARLGGGSSQNGKFLKTSSGFPGWASVVAADVSDSTTLGRAIMAIASAAALAATHSHSGSNMGPGEKLYLASKYR